MIWQPKLDFMMFSVHFNLQLTYLYIAIHFYHKEYPNRGIRLIELELVDTSVNFILAWYHVSKNKILFQFFHQMHDNSWGIKNAMHEIQSIYLMPSDEMWVAITLKLIQNINKNMQCFTMIESWAYPNIHTGVHIELK